MTSDLYGRMKAWLNSGNDTEKTHARHRLAMPDALEFERTGVETVPEYPSFGSMVVNAAATFADFVADGLALADEPEVSRRLDECRKCHMYDDEQLRCRACGCFLQGKAKIAAAKCPLDKWDAV